MTRHHEDKAKHMGGQVEVSIELKVLAAHLSGFSDLEIAQKYFGLGDTETRQMVRELIAVGRKKALGAH